MDTSSALAAPRSDPLRGALWMVSACVFFSVLTGLIRHLSATLDPFEIVFFRNLFSLLVMLPWLARGGFGALRTRRLPLLGVRAVIALVAMLTWFTAISWMNLADAVALSFTSPLFATVAAVFLLNEVVRLRRWTAIGVGFAGAMIILRPGFEAITPAALLVLVSAAAMAVSMCLVKILSRTESVGAIVFYMVLMLTPASLIPALFVWRTPTPEELFWLVGLGAMATLGHLCLGRAFAIADATAVLPFDFVRLPLITAIGYVVFDQTVDAWTGVGAAVIIASSVYIAHREAVHHRQVSVPPPRLDGEAVPPRPEPRPAAE